MARPKIDEADKKISVHITLSKEHAKLLKDFGNGNTSNAIKKLVALISDK